uniref:TACC_C domain-containing protein n=1 Tax=Panagrellus redivivus TaxID=6233 RepID=A0A7E4VJP0_PANRE
MTCNIPTSSFLAPANSASDSEPFFFGTSTATTTWGIPLQDVNKPWFSVPSAEKPEAVEQLKKEMEELKKSVNELTAKNQQLEEENANLQKSVFDLKRKHESKETQDAKKMAELSQTILYAKSEITTLCEEKEELKLRAKNDKLHLSKLERSAQDVGMQLRNTQDKLNDTMEDCIEHLEENSRLEEKNAKLSKQLKLYERRVKEVERKLAEQTAKIEAEAAAKAAKEAAEAAKEAAEYEHVEVKPKVVQISSEDDFELVSDVEVSSK